MELLITDRNFASARNDDGEFVVTEIAEKLDDDGNVIPFRPFGEFLIKRAGSAPGVDEWGVTAQSLSESQRVEGHKLRIALNGKTRSAAIVEPTEPDVVVAPEKFIREVPVAPLALRELPDPVDNEDLTKEEAVLKSDHDAAIVQHEKDVAAYTLAVEEFDAERKQHAEESTAHSDFKQLYSKYEDEVKTRIDCIASTEESYTEHQKAVDFAAAKRVLVENKLSSAGVKSSALAKVFRGGRLDPSDFN